jgi:hypothetical protein
MPYVWTVIQFDANGTLRRFSPDGTTTSNMSVFPTVYVYSRGASFSNPAVQQIATFAQWGLELFVPLDASYFYLGVQ